MTLGDVMLTSMKSCRSPTKMNISPAAGETAQFIPSPRDVATQFAVFESGGLLHLQERVYRSRIHDMKELKERLLRKWRLLDHFNIAAVIAQWHSCLSACVHVNGEQFEHKF